MAVNQVSLDVIYLASCAVNKQVPSKIRIESMDLDAVFAYASHHMVSASIAMALISAGYNDRQSTDTIAYSLRRTVIFQDAFAKVKDSFEREGIWYMLLKGAVLKDMYPKYGMREFADYDILIDASRASDVKRIMENLGFTSKRSENSAEDVYYKPPILNFEIHKALFNPSNSMELYKYYQDVGQRLEKGQGFERHFTPEDFYLYLTAHEFKHYINRGTGLRSLLDTYIFLKESSLNIDYISDEAEKLGIDIFEKQNRSLSLHLFGNGDLTDEDKKMLDYIASSGTFGTIPNMVQNKIQRNKWSKLQYMLHRFFVPVSKKNKDYANYALVYPLFYKYKILLPFLPFYRVFKALKNGRFRAEAKAIINAKNID